MMAVPTRYIVYLILIVIVLIYVVTRKNESAEPASKESFKRPTKPLFNPPDQPETIRTISTKKELDQIVSSQSSSDGIMDIETLKKFKGKLSPAQIQLYKSQMMNLLSQGKYSEAIQLGAIVLSRIEDARLFEEFSVWLEKYEKQVEKDWTRKNFGPEELRGFSTDQLIFGFMQVLTETDASKYYDGLRVRKLSKSQIGSLISYFWQTDDNSKKDLIIRLLSSGSDPYLTGFLKDIIATEKSPNLRYLALGGLYAKELTDNDYDFLRKLYESDPVSNKMSETNLDTNLYNDYMRETAFDILMRSKYKNKNELIRQSLNSNDPLNRKLAIRQLGISGNKEILLKATSSDSSPSVREEAYVHLIRNFVIGDPILGYGPDRVRDDETSIRAIIHGMTNDSDEKVRLAIIDSLDMNKLKSSRYKAEFETALETLARNDPSEDVRLEASQALQSMRHTDK